MLPAKLIRQALASISLRDHPADIPIIAAMAPATTMPAAIEAAVNSKSLVAKPISAKLTMLRRCRIDTRMWRAVCKFSVRELEFFS